ncbi:MAG TPA: DUF6089 family protein [Bacteroidia bacterium]|nr:DUF6089 family protein [Bacteroidia bacterium]
MKRFLVYTFCLLFISAQAQTRKRTFKQNELGFLFGGSYYIGDLNNRSHFIYSQPAFGIFYRLSNNYRTAFRFGFNYGKLSAYDTQHNIAYQQERNLAFTSTLYEGHALAEFNFTEYRIGNDKHRFTLFIFAGLAGLYAKTEASGGIGPSEGKTLAPFQITVPFGIGIKANLGKRVGLTLEWGPRRTFTDYLDNVSATYPAGGGSPSETQSKGGPAPGSEGYMRGDPTMKDWYFFYGLTLNVKLPDSHRTCHGSGHRRQ